METFFGIVVPCIEEKVVLLTSVCELLVTVDKLKKTLDLLSLFSEWIRYA